MIKNILLSILVALTLSETSFSQKKYYEDIFYGNVAVIGLDMWDSTSFNLNDFGATNNFSFF